MAGIYVHIPFCKQACHYCNFHFSTTLNLKNDFIEALLREISLRKDYLGKDAIETIYFGGGTPSILDGKDLELIIENLVHQFDCSRVTEITLESNPDDMEAGKIKSWKRAGINRLSVGIQSFVDEDLKWMNRSHSGDQAEKCIHFAQDEAFSNISADLIYGYPQLSDDGWRKNVQKALELKIPHLSCYALTIEPKTALQHFIQAGKAEQPSAEDQARQYILLMQWLEDSGYEHYEISNFSLPGMRSRHNSSYWQGKKYIGIGPSAHSYDQRSRQWNVSNNNQYIQSLKNNVAPFDTEELTPVQELNEYIMVSLRTRDGINLNEILRRFGVDIKNQLFANSKRWLNDGNMILHDHCLILSREGKLLADGIAAHLFFEKEPSESPR